ncbi:MAG: four helix bundle protein [SAR202 cluster bacterium]|nr:four helix bundle protein [SAR202 cluster bacterium]
MEEPFLFATRIINLCRALERDPGVSRILAAQVLRSGTSIGANIEEGQAGQSRADFLGKLSIACKEARETHYWLRLLAASDTVPKDTLSDLIAEANEIVAILTSIVKRTRSH